MFVWYYLHYAFYLLYDDSHDLIPDNYKNIFNDFTEKIKLTDSTDIETAIFRYQKQYNSEIPTNTELPIKQVVKEYRKYLQWKINNNIKYFKGHN